MSLPGMGLSRTALHSSGVVIDDPIVVLAKGQSEPDYIGSGAKNRALKREPERSRSEEKDF